MRMRAEETYIDGIVGPGDDWGRHRASRQASVTTTMTLRSRNLKIKLYWKGDQKLEDDSEARMERPRSTCACLRIRQRQKVASGMKDKSGSP